MLTVQRAALLVSVLAIMATVGAFVASAALLTDDSYEATGSLSNEALDLMLMLPFTVVGVLITLKRPENLIGWALLLAAVGNTVGNLLSIYAELALLAKPEAHLPAAIPAATLGAGSWTALMASVFLLLPDIPHINRLGAIDGVSLRLKSTLALASCQSALSTSPSPPLHLPKHAALEGPSWNLMTGLPALLFGAGLRVSLSPLLSATSEPQSVNALQ